MPTNYGFYGIYPVTLTRFLFPVTQDVTKVVEDEDSEQARIWTAGTKPLVMAPGHKASVIARIRENPSQVLLLTSKTTFRTLLWMTDFNAWEDISNLKDFQNSASYPLYHAALSVHGQPSVPQIIEFGSQRGIQYGPQMNSYISLRTVYFPSNLNGEQSTAAFNTPGFVDWVSSRSGNNSARSLLAETWKSWIDGEVVFNGEKVKAMVVVYWWNGWEKRKTYLEWREPGWEREMYRSDGTVPENNVGMTRGEVWDKKLRGKGALGWKDESFQVYMLPIGLWFIEWSWHNRQSRVAAS